ncbi:MAG: IS66 family transposase [Clostridia bacterium]|nr:IS66 family transposase [Clostridia bacterium]
MSQNEYKELLDLRVTVNEQKILIKELESKIENLTQAILHGRKKQFGPSSEKTPKESEPEIPIFNEAEVESKSNAKEPTENTVIIKRTPRKPGVREDMIKHLPREKVECILEGKDANCPQCGSKTTVIGKTIVRTELEFIPAHVKVIDYVQYAHKCIYCGKSDDKPEDVIIKAPVPAPVMQKSLASPSTVAQVIYQKYMIGMPLKRQEYDWKQHGYALSRSTMANWVIRCTQDWLKPIYLIMRDDMVNSQIIGADETRIQCNKEEGKKASSQSFMWVYRTGIYEKQQMVLYEYTRTRAGKHVKSFLEGFEGFLVSDAYAGYELVENITRCLCWSHCRRYFINAIPLDGKKEIPGSKGAEGREYCNQLFDIEQELEKLSPEIRHSKRQELSRKILDEFWCWVEKTSIMPTTNTKLQDAFTYAKNQKNYLENFLLDGRIPISNNHVENAIRPFATHRRSWLFADTPKGAEASAIAYSIIETAKANNLNIYEYLVHIFKCLPNLDFSNNPDLLRDFLPWSEKLPESCRL